MKTKKNGRRLIRSERERFGLTQEGLGEEMGVTRNTVTRWEMGLYPVPRWAQYFVTMILPGLMKGKGASNVSGAQKR